MWIEAQQKYKPGWSDVTEAQVIPLELGWWRARGVIASLKK